MKFPSDLKFLELSIDIADMRLMNTELVVGLVKIIWSLIRWKKMQISFLRPLRAIIKIKLRNSESEGRQN